MKVKRGRGIRRGRCMVGRKGFEMAISTIVIIVLALLILLALTLAFTSGFGKFWLTIKGYFSSDIDSISKTCYSQCISQSKYSFCCENKTLGKENIICTDTRIKIDCEINCEGVC